MDVGPLLNTWPMSRTEVLKVDSVLSKSFTTASGQVFCVQNVNDATKPSSPHTQGCMNSNAFSSQAMAVMHSADCRATLGPTEGPYAHICAMSNDLDNNPTVSNGGATQTNDISQAAHAIL